MILPKISVIKVDLPEGEKRAYSKHGNHKAFVPIIACYPTIYTPITLDSPANYNSFDSILEAKVFLYLRQLEHQLSRDTAAKLPSLYFSLKRQVTINLLPTTAWEVKLTHVVDFSLSLMGVVDGITKTLATWYIEAKGKPTDVAICKWKVLECHKGLFNSKEYFVIGTPKKQVQTIPGHYIYPMQQGLDAVEKAINDYLVAYESINGRLG